MSAAFLHGFLLAFAIILPFGPQNTLILQQGLRSASWRPILPIVLTAGLSDTLLIIAAVAGASTIVRHFPWIQDLLSLIGLIFLIVLGIHTWNTVPINPLETPAVSGSLRQKIRHSLSTSLLNPHAISDTLLVIGGNAAAYDLSHRQWAFAAGAISVSWLWFSILSVTGRLLQRLPHPLSIQRIMNRGSALLMWLVALQFAYLLAHSLIR
ncbi:MAG: LysE family transporter [Firmicutes bacterium]|nr:LysE family transporter [Bacillota bacterium]